MQPAALAATGTAGPGPVLLLPLAGELNSHIFRIIDSPEDEGVDPLACTGRGISVHDAFRRLNQKLDGDASHLQPSPSLQFLELPVEALHVVGAAALRQTDTRKPFMNDGFKVIVGH